MMETKERRSYIGIGTRALLVVIVLLAVIAVVLTISNPFIQSRQYQFYDEKWQQVSNVFTAVGNETTNGHYLYYPNGTREYIVNSISFDVSKRFIVANHGTKAFIVYVESWQSNFLPPSNITVSLSWSGGTISGTSPPNFSVDEPIKAGEFRAYSLEWKYSRPANATTEVKVNVGVMAILGVQEV
jgi:hypothetical protein